MELNISTPWKILGVCVACFLALQITCSWQKSMQGKYSALESECENAIRDTLGSQHILGVPFTYLDVKFPDKPLLITSIPAQLKFKGEFLAPPKDGDLNAPAQRVARIVGYADKNQRLQPLVFRCELYRSARDGSFDLNKVYKVTATRTEVEPSNSATADKDDETSATGSSKLPSARGANTTDTTIKTKSTGGKRLTFASGTKTSHTRIEATSTDEPLGW